MFSLTPDSRGWSVAPAHPEDAPEVLSLYRSLLGVSGCTWGEDYPNLDYVTGDIRRGSLYCMRDEGGTLLGAASAGEPDEDIRSLPCWNQSAKCPCELARVGIRRDRHGEGLAQGMLRLILSDAARRGYDSVRLLVGEENPAAVSLYRKLGFVAVGRTRLYNTDWLCEERPLPLL